MQLNNHDGIRFTLGIGLTNRCNTNCPHCYSRPDNGSCDLDPKRLSALLDTIPVKSINFGNGESVFHPRFREIINEIADRGIPMAVTTNGATVSQLSDNEIRLFNDIDFSLDFPVRELNDDWRGMGSFDSVMKGINKCKKLGVEASLVSCLMNNNYNYMGKMADLAVKLELNLRINIYKSVFTDRFRPSYNEFWTAISDLSHTAYFTACSEPIVNAAINNRNNGCECPCGNQSIRIHPGGTVVPCVYLNNNGYCIEDLIEDYQDVSGHLSNLVNLPLPGICRECELSDICNGGCSSRRIINGNPTSPDEYCFKIKDEIPKISARWKESKGLVHEDYLCTMIFSG